MQNLGSTKVYIRPIMTIDNEALFKVIETVMYDFVTCGEGTILSDPTARNMAACYEEDRAVYYVAFVDGKLVGGCGIRQLAGASEAYCELQRLFLLPESRGTGLGHQLMQLCMDKAVAFGYRYCYLETLENMIAAQKLYKKWDFIVIDQALGNTGHGGCNVWMLKEFNPRQSIKQCFYKKY
ncbi:MAG: GNAT family N-acetyltransferase [Flammeovirgaceae bacterium]